MSSIGPTGSTPTPLPSVGGPAPTAAATPAPPLPPIFQQAFSGAGLAGALGLAPPRSPGNSEALFLEITGKLESARSENEESGDTSKSEKRRTDFASAAAILNQLLDITNSIQVQQDNVKKQDEKVADLKEQKEPLVAERDSKQASINANRDGIAYESGLISSRRASIATYELLKAATTDPNTIAFYNNQIASLNGLINLAQSLINQYQANINVLQPQVDALNTQIASIDAEIAAAEASKADSLNQIANLQNSYNTIMLSLFPMAIAMMLGLSSAAAREAAENPEVLTEFDRVGQEALNETNRIPNQELDFEQLRGKVMEGNTLDPSRADRVSFRFASFVSTVQAAFAGLDTLGQMADLANSGGAPTFNGRERIAI